MSSFERTRLGNKTCTRFSVLAFVMLARFSFVGSLVFCCLHSDTIQLARVSTACSRFCPSFCSTDLCEIQFEYGSWVKRDWLETYEVMRRYNFFYFLNISMSNYFYHFSCSCSFDYIIQSSCVNVLYFCLFIFFCSFLPSCIAGICGLLAQPSLLFCSQTLSVR